MEMVSASLEGRRSGHSLAFGKQLAARLKCSDIKMFGNAGNSSA